MVLSRRCFLGGAGLGLASALGVRGEAGVRRAAVIGHTGRGDYGHGLEGIFRGRPGIEVVAVADPDQVGRTRALARVGAGAARGYEDYREMLRVERPELVSLAMRHADQHHAIGLDCLRAGAHLYVEKPFTRSAAEADDLLREADARGLCIAVAHTMRMMPQVLRLRQAVREGLFGELREMRAFGKQDHRAGGEDMMVLGSHLFDLFRAFAGDPHWVTARVLAGERDIRTMDRRRVRDEVGWVAGDRVFAHFAFSGAVEGTFTSDERLREVSGHWGIELWGSRGVARLNGDITPNVFVRSASGWSDRGREDRWVPLDPALVVTSPEHHLGPVGDWLTAIEERREPECSGRNGAWAVEMVSGVYAATLSGRRVLFPLKDRGHPLEGEG